MIRYAIVRGARNDKEVAAYLPDNYSVVPHDWRNHPTQTSANDCQVCAGREVIITGQDKMGWTLADYVRPRLGSGSMACEEIDLNHSAMKSVPR